MIESSQHPNPIYSLDDVERIASLRHNDAREFTAKASSWFLATSIAVNGGAVLALFNAGDRLGYNLWLYLPFVVGIVLALASSAISTQLSFSDGENALDLLNRIAALRRAGDDGISADDKYLVVLHFSWVLRNTPFILRMLCGFCFIAGVAVVAFHMPSTDIAATRRCEALQNDMLAAKSLRTDSRELSGTLGCRPRGEGSVYAMRR